MLPPAPGLLSTMNCWPRTSVIFKATKRAIVSAPPPGVNGMRMRTGLFGQVDCAIAGEAMPGASVAAAESLSRRRRSIMGPPGGDGLVRCGPFVWMILSYNSLAQPSARQTVAPGSPPLLRRGIKHPPGNANLPVQSAPAYDAQRRD